MADISLREEHLERHRRQAAEAFSRHAITKHDDRRWLLQRMHADGKPEWVYAAEIIVLEGGSLYVGGDIDHVVFACGPHDPMARLRWIGECRDLGWYVAQKARIGMGGRDGVDVWDGAIAAQELRRWLRENPEELEDPDALDDACGADERNDFYDAAIRAIREGDAHEIVGPMGEVLAPRVIYAHAALARLCELLRQQEKEAESKEGT